MYILDIKMTISNFIQFTFLLFLNMMLKELVVIKYDNNNTDYF